MSLRAYIEHVLAETRGNCARAAERVGAHRQSPQQKLKDLGPPAATRFGTKRKIPMTSEGLS